MVDEFVPEALGHGSAGDAAQPTGQGKISA
jgi:hypothetical protein